MTTVSQGSPRPTLRCGDRLLPLGERCFVMGIVNVTPDSFSDGGTYLDAQRAIDHALTLCDDGADIIDVGGESTRPGAVTVDVDTERRRVLPVLEGLVRRGLRNLSIDTRHAAVAADALAIGASWVNDVGGFGDPAMGTAALRADAAVLMHWRQATHFDAQGDHVVYDDVVADVGAFLAERTAHAIAHGVSASAVVVDPGLGFGKSLVDNLRLLQAGHALRARSGAAAVLLGPSRKRFLGALTGRSVPAERDAATVGAACLAAFHGADVVRVHDVRSTVDALRVAQSQP
jgi:dihydropteroate synthase